MALSRRANRNVSASIWPGFVDAMTALLLVLMFVLTIFMVVQFVLRETISGQESELDALSAQVRELADALVDAFGNKDELGRLVTVNLDMNLESVAGGSTLAAIAFDLVDWAKRSGYLSELIQGALDTKPRNAKLRAFAVAIGATERD